MSRLFVVDWDRESALALVRRLRREGFTVAYHWDRETGAETWKRIKARPPDALVVSLARLPSHGRRVAAVTAETKRLAEVPVVFVDGAPDKAAAARREFPGAVFTDSARLPAALKRLGRS